MNIEILNRYEKKYLLTKEEYSRIHKELIEYLKFDNHIENGKPYIVSSIYYDTPNFKLIRDARKHPLHKQKLRIRNYSIIAKKDEIVFLELKNKNHGYVTKDRSLFRLNDATNFIRRGYYEDESGLVDESIIDKVASFIRKHKKLIPAMLITYERLAYFGKYDSNLRITFDFNIKYRKDNLTLCYPSVGERLFPEEEDYIVMEIKYINKLPKYIKEIFKKNKLKSKGFSKYMQIYKLINKL